MKRSTVLAMLAKAKAAFPRFPVEPETDGVYVEALADLDATDAEGNAAVMSCIKASEYFPAITEVRLAILREMAKRNGPLRLECWDDLSDDERVAFNKAASSARYKEQQAKQQKYIESVGGEQKYYELICAKEAEENRLYREERNRRKALLLNPPKEEEAQDEENL